MRPATANMATAAAALLGASASAFGGRRVFVVDTSSRPPLQPDAPELSAGRAAPYDLTPTPAHLRRAAPGLTDADRARILAAQIRRDRRALRPQGVTRKT